MLAKLDLPADGVITRAVFERLPVAPRNWAWELHDGRLGIPNYWIVRRDPRAADPEVVDGMITMYELRDGTYYTAGYKAVSKL